MDLNMPTVAVQIGNFIVFAVILYYFLFRNLDKALQERQSLIAKELDDAKKANEDAQAQKKKYEESLKNIEIDSADIISHASDLAEKMRKSIIDEANAVADRIREKNEAEIADLKEKAYREINKEVGDLAVALAGKLLESSLDANTHKFLINNFAKKVESGDVR